jgi:hypothetical protein
VGDTAVLEATIRNTGSAPTPGGLVSWEEGENTIGVSPIGDLEPGEAATISIEHLFDDKKICNVTCRLNSEDDLPLDNDGHVIVESLDRIPILFVDGGSPNDKSDLGARFFMAALGYGPSDSPGGWQSVFLPKRVKPSDLVAEELSDYACVVLSNTEAPSATDVAALKAYVRKGGGLWVALGTNTDPTAYNALFYEGGEGLSPVLLDLPVGDPKIKELFEEIHPPSAVHRATRLLADTERLDIGKAKVYRRLAVGAQGLSDDSILLRTNSGKPIAIERSFGRGRVIVQTLSFGPEWSDVPLSQSYVVMVSEWLSYLCEPSATARNLNPGEVLSIALSAAEFEESGQIIAPDRRTFDVIGVSRGNRRVYEYSKTMLPGVYTLVLSGNGKKTEMPFYVSRDPKESDLTLLEPADYSNLKLAGGISLALDPLEVPRTSKTADTKEPMWKWLLLGAILFMLLEVLLAVSISRRRSITTPGITVEERPDRAV